MKRINILKTLLLGFTLVAFTACSEDLDKADYDRQGGNGVLATVTTGAVDAYGIAAKAAITVDLPEGAQLKEAGFVVSTDEEMELTSPNTQIIRAADVKAGESVITAITGLTPGKTYYVKAYAYTEGGIAYGETKTIVASNDYEQATDIAVDFTDPDFADGQYFTSTKLEGSTIGFQLMSLAAIFGVPQLAFVSSPYHPGYLSQGSAQLASPEENNLLSFKADLTDMAFPSVSIDAFNLAALFGDSYTDCPGNFDVYVSATAPKSAGDLAGATLLGSCGFSDDPTSPDFEEKVVSYELPLSFNGECYITLHSHCGHPNYYAGNNLGVIVLGFELSSLHRVK